MTNLLKYLANGLDQMILQPVAHRHDQFIWVEGDKPWIQAFIPNAKQGETLDISQHSLFLSDFLVEAKMLWSTEGNGMTKSGLWTEVTESGYSLNLEAIAIVQNSQPLLVIVNKSDEFAYRQRTLQSARELMLANDKLLEQHDYLHNRLLTILKSPKIFSDSVGSLAVAIEHAGFAVMILDQQLQLITENPAVEELFEYNIQQQRSVPTPRETLLNLMRTQLPEYERIFSTGSSWSGEVCWMHPPHTLKWLKLAIYPVTHESTQARNWVFFINDITHIKYLLQRNEQLTFQDPLTHLPNRHAFWQTLQQRIDKQEPFYLLYVDINHFKRINEFYNHAEGDKLLVELAGRLHHSLKKKDFIARVGGDEFAIILAGVDCEQDCKKITSRLLNVAEQRFYTESGEHYQVGLCIGATSFPHDAQKVEELMKFADLSAYNGRKHKTSSVQFYSQKLKEASRQRIEMEGALVKAISKDEFELLLQPILNLQSGKIFKAEALIRWNHPEKGLIMPADFIPVAEQSGLIAPIGRWVFERSCHMLKILQQAGFKIKIAVNLSPLQVIDKTFFDFVRTCLEQTQVDPAYLTLEITEGVLVNDYRQIHHLLLRIRDMGISISVDDFGTGYSSLAYLKKLPLDFLKIDRSFVQDIVTDDNDKAIVSAIIAMAHKLNLGVIAEGVETHEQRDFLTLNSCNSAQGYLFSRPIKLDALLTLLADN